MENTSYFPSKVVNFQSLNFTVIGELSDLTPLAKVHLNGKEYCNVRKGYGINSYKSFSSEINSLHDLSSGMSVEASSLSDIVDKLKDNLYNYLVDSLSKYSLLEYEKHDTISTTPTKPIQNNDNESKTPNIDTPPVHDEPVSESATLNGKKFSVRDIDYMGLKYDVIEINDAPFCAITTNEINEFVPMSMDELNKKFFEAYKKSEEQGQIDTSNSSIER